MTETKDGEMLTYHETDQDGMRSAMMTAARDDLVSALGRIALWGGPKLRLPDKLEEWFVSVGVKV